MFKTLLGLIVLFSITACGGGGGGSSGPVASTSAFPLRQANINSFVAGTTNFTLSGTYSNAQASGSGTETDSALTSGTFEGISGFQQTTNTSLTIIAGGVSTPSTSVSTSWFDTNYNPIGVTGDEYVVIDQPVGQLPVAAHVNDTGTWLTAKRYSDSTKATLNGTTTITYKLNADTATTALLSLIRVDKDNSGALISTETQVYRITPTGSQTLLTDTLVETGTSLVFTYQ